MIFDTWWRIQRLNEIKQRWRWIEGTGRDLKTLIERMSIWKYHSKIRRTTNHLSLLSVCQTRIWLWTHYIRRNTNYLSLHERHFINKYLLNSSIFHFSLEVFIFHFLFVTFHVFTFRIYLKFISQFLNLPLKTQNKS